MPLINRRTALTWGGGVLLSALLSLNRTMVLSARPDGTARSYRLPLIPVPDGVEVVVPQDFLTGLAPGGCSQWAAFRAFDLPALVLFPAQDMQTVESLVEELFGSTDRITGELLTSLVLADAREVMYGDRPFGIATLDHDLVAHPGLSDVVEDLHGIGQSQLDAEGRDVMDVARALNEALGGKAVFSDAPEFDRHWLDMLFDETVIEPVFHLRSVTTLINGGPALVAVDAPIPAAAAEPPPLSSHRAKDDAMALALAFWKTLLTS